MILALPGTTGTARGQIRYSWAPAAPEQYGYARTDQRTGLYALGVTLIWILTGSYDPGALEKALCSRRLKRCLQKAAALALSERYSSAREMGRAPSVAGGGEPAFPAVPAAILAAVLAVCLFFALPQASGPDSPKSSPSPPSTDFAQETVPAVEFGSPLLEQAVREELDMPQGGITAEDLTRVRRLAAVGRTVMGQEQVYEYRLAGYPDGVYQRGVDAGGISDLSLLSAMTNPRELYLCAQQISDLSCLAGLPLETLYLCDNQISDLSPLASLTGLRRLNLDQWDAPYTVGSLSPLTGFRWSISLWATWSPPTRTGRPWTG